MQRRPYLIASLGAALGLASAIAPTTLAAALLYESGALLALVLAWVAWRRIPGPRRAWTLATVALTLWITGDLIWDGLQVAGVDADVSVADGFYVAAYVVFAFAVLRLLSPQVVGRREALLDGSAFAASVAAVTWIFLIRPRTDVASTALERVVAASYPLLDVLLIAALLWLVLTPGGDGRAKRLLVLAMTAMAAVDLAYAALLIRDSGIWLDIANAFYPTAYALFACAIVEAGRETVRPAARSVLPQLHPGRALLLGVALLLAPAAAVLSATSHTSDRLFLPVVTSAVAILVLTRFVHEARAREQIHAEILHLASHDPLTGLLNRRAFEEHLRDVLNAGPCTVLYVDLDRLKWLNDSAGHSAGDRVLVQVGRRLADVVREGDIVARLGGDEFAVCCPGLSDATVADLLADRVLAALADVHPEITASVGLATTDEDRIDPEALLREADDAMYRAKRSGGNQRARAEHSVAN